MALNIFKNSLKVLNIQQFQRRFLSSSNEIQRRACQLYSLEQKRQRNEIGRIEKIEVRYLGTPDDTTLVMNKGLSTPYDCAKHLGEKYCRISALALLDSNVPWDMHRALNESCTLQLLNFTAADPHAVNRAFWRSCSFLLGSVLQKSFKIDAGLLLHSFPVPNIKSGSFIYDICVPQKNWKPTMQELRTLSIEMIKLSQEDLKIERLDIRQDLAMEMFEGNPYKREQIPNISSHNNGLITVYRVGDHLDISKGPMICRTSSLGKCTIASVHELPGTGDDSLRMYRVQGVALPNGLHINHFAYGILENRAMKLNHARLPNEPYEESAAEMIA